MSRELSHKAMQEMDRVFQLRHQALEIFKLVVAEWSSDPHSVQCFDLRMVEKARVIHEQLKRFDHLY